MRTRPGTNFLEPSELDLVPMLKKLYEFESIKASGPGSARRSLTEIAWSRDEFAAWAGIAAASHPELDRLLETLEKKEQLLRLGGDAPRFVTRTAETVRLLGHSYEYWQGGRPGVDAVRWLVEDKLVPRRDIAAPRFVELLVKALATEELEVDRASLGKGIEYAVQAVARSLTRGKDWTQATFSQFQLDSAVAMIGGHYRKAKDAKTRRNQMLVAGVGSGKTAAFQIGVLAIVLQARLQLAPPRTQMLLYPRTALAQDQFKSLERVAKHVTHIAPPRIQFDHISAYKTSVAQGVRDAYRGEAPDVVVTTLETLKRRLYRREFIHAMRNNLEGVVLDEVHLVEGTTGTNVVRLLDRLRQVCAPRGLRWTGVSATVALPERHAATVFGVSAASVDVVEPPRGDMASVGVVHHVFLKPEEGMSTLGCLVNATSILIHNRRGALGDRDQVDPLPKAVGFADNLDALGRWNADLRENERTENVPKKREHAAGPDPADWKPGQRDLPYAHRFHKPLQRRIRAGEGADAPYPRVLSDRTFDDCCDRCYAGERAHVGTVRDAGELRELGRLVTRAPVKEGDKPEGYYLQHPAFQWAPTDTKRDVGTLDLCPFLQAGACFRFPRDTIETAPIPTTSAHEWRNVARSKVHSSKTKSDKEGADDLQDLVFTASAKNVYDIGSDEAIGVDLVLASPSLEVGIDLPNVTEEMMFKAIRNIASYRQKAGRAGREAGSDVMIVTLLTKRAIDFHYYRQPRKLVALGNLDPVPLKEHNPALLRSALYMGLWDYLSLRTPLNDLVPKDLDSSGVSRFSAIVQQAYDHLGSQRHDAERHLRELSREHASAADIAAALEQVRADLRVLLTPTVGVIENDDMHTLADVAVNFIQWSGGKRIKYNDAARSVFMDVEETAKDFDKFRPKIDAVGLGMADEFLALDNMRRAGWEVDELQAIHARLEAKAVGLPRNISLKRILDAIETTVELLRSLEGMTPKPHPAAWFYTDQLEKTFSGARGKAYYLSYQLEELPIFRYRRSDPSVSLLPNLFTNPYIPQVELHQRNAKGHMWRIDTVPVAEALYAAIPGTWTYRFGGALKTLSAELTHTAGGILVSDFERLSSGTGHQFVSIATDVRGPPWMPDKLDIYRPVRLVTQWAPKYLLMDAASARVMDGDELDARGDEGHNRIKIPRTHAERWLVVTPQESVDILVNDLDFDAIQLESPEGVLTGPDARARVRHPMLTGLLTAVKWHERISVTEYVHAVGRSYTSRETAGAQLEFDHKGKRVAFGHKYLTEGVSFELDVKTVQDTIDATIEGVLTSGRAWAPTALKALAAIVRAVLRDEEEPVSPYVLRDLLALVLAQNARLEKGTLAEFREAIRSLSADPERLATAAWDYARIKAKLVEDHIHEDLAEREAGGRAEEMAQRLRDDLVAGLQALAKHLDKIEAGLKEWAQFTLLNTFGIVASQALQRLSGTAEEKLGYYPDLDALKDDVYRIYLYDREDFGNGSSRLLRDFLHILYVQRVGKYDHETRRLPTEDFLTILEQQLLQCPQFHTDVNALAMFAQAKAGRPVNGLPELKEYTQHATEVLRTGEAAWSKLGVDGPQDAWRLPLLHAAYQHVAHAAGIPRDDVYRATGACWNGCPECVLTDSMLMGPVTGPDYVDKAILDAWFSRGRARIGEYERVTLDEFARGDGPQGVGAKTALYADVGAKRYRAVRLPFTVGVDVDREAPDAPPGLVFRQGDFAGHLLDPAAPSDAKIMSLGLSRLLWYQLLSSSYLAGLGKIPPAERRVTMVFYDVRDVAVDDSALSEKMRETIEAIKRLDGRPRPVLLLSEMVSWMLQQGYEFTICVDAAQAKEEAVRSFLEKVRAEAGPTGVRLRVKDLGRAAMHAKGIITPAGGLHGSANLTWSGTKRNDELFSYVRPGAPAYKDLRTELDDIIANSDEWKP